MHLPLEATVSHEKPGPIQTLLVLVVLLALSWFAYSEGLWTDPDVRRELIRMIVENIAHALI
jgi:hypothetical protein